jgi:hypothetical protein
MKTKEPLKCLATKERTKNVLRDDTTFLTNEVLPRGRILQENPVINS